MEIIIVILAAIYSNTNRLIDRYYGEKSIKRLVVEVFNMGCCYLFTNLWCIGTNG